MKPTLLVTIGMNNLVERRSGRMFEEVNFELQLLADEATLQNAEEIYNDMIDQMCAEHDMQMYACHSYDLDAEFYGKGN